MSDLTDQAAMRAEEEALEWLDPAVWMVCPSCDEIVPRNEANEHVCPIEELDGMD